MSSRIQYIPFSSSIDPIFWNQFTELKLNKLCLSTEPVDVKATYSSRIIDGVPPLLSLGFDALKSETNIHPSEHTVRGTLINTNTIEDFKTRDKTKLLNDFAQKHLWESINFGQAENDPSVLNSFLLFTFADLKKYKYYYWFAFPALLFPSTVLLKHEPQLLKFRFDKEMMVSLSESYSKAERSEFFIFQHYEDGNSKIFPLADYPKLKADLAEGDVVYLGFADPCSHSEFPGWPLRNLLTLVAVKWPFILEHSVLCMREHMENGILSINRSLVLDIEFDPNDVVKVSSSMPSCVGWERNERDKLGPRFVNLKNSMDPVCISDSAVSLNLQLMRWRLAPDLELDSIRKSRCLLFGAGTLGCNVARCLIGWGVKTITFVDSGQVSYSNPVRQSLFTFEHAKCNGRNKASVAAEVLKEICPSVESAGVVMTIPMPGHTVGENQVHDVKETVLQLTSLIKSHDVLFLLTDSRESRWLPTLLGTVNQKLILTAALGFDSFLVMRHGTQPCGMDTLGCYFCNDVVAPGDSMSDRSLDQQCTVTRPGMSFMAAGHVVEMMVSSIQLKHDLKSPNPSSAEGASCSKPNVSSCPEGSLGLVPHSIRYYLGRLHQLSTHTESFISCSACGQKVQGAYLENEFSFLLNVFNSTLYLEEVCGLTQLHKDSDQAEIWEISDAEESDMDD